MKPAKRKPRKPSKAEVKAAASRAEATSRGEPAADPKVAITPEITPAAEIKEGRPSGYKPEFAEQAVILCRLGATDEELALFFKVSVRTVYRWKVQHEEFCQAIKTAASTADDRVERSLYHKAVGYTYDAVKIMMHQGMVIREEYKEHVPPDTTAAIFWLKNRQPEKWRDKVAMEHTGKDGGPIETSTSEPKPIPSDHLSDITKRFSSRVPADTVGTGAKTAEKPAKGAGLH